MTILARLSQQDASCDRILHPVVVSPKHSSLAIPLTTGGRRVQVAVDWAVLQQGHRPLTKLSTTYVRTPAIILGAAILDRDTSKTETSSAGAVL
jgi:hypothetical protein